MGNESSSKLNQQAIEGLLKTTAFNEVNIRELYRHFRRMCAGDGSRQLVVTMSRDVFDGLFEETFYGRNITAFSHHVFRTLDKHRNGLIDFKTFISGLNVHVNGTDIEKAKWCFNLLDVNRNGVISRQEALEVIQCYYDLHARLTPLENVVSPETYRNMIFKQAERANKDTLDQKSFLRAVRSSNTVKLLVDTLSAAALEPYNQRKRRTASIDAVTRPRSGTTVTAPTDPTPITSTMQERRRTVSL